MCLYPLESMAMEVCVPTLPVESIIPDGIKPPELVDVEVGDMIELLVNTRFR